MNIKTTDRFPLSWQLSIANSFLVGDGMGCGWELHFRWGLSLSWFSFSLFSQEHFKDGKNVIELKTINREKRSEPPWHSPASNVDVIWRVLPKQYIGRSISTDLKESRVSPGGQHITHAQLYHAWLEGILRAGNNMLSVVQLPSNELNLLIPRLGVEMLQNSNRHGNWKLWAASALTTPWASKALRFSPPRSCSSGDSHMCPLSP